jgi:hypothetical protein
MSEAELRQLSAEKGAGSNAVRVGAAFPEMRHLASALSITKKHFR